MLSLEAALRPSPSVQLARRRCPCRYRVIYFSRVLFGTTCAHSRSISPCCFQRSNPARFFDPYLFCSNVKGWSIRAERFTSSPLPLLVVLLPSNLPPSSFSVRNCSCNYCKVRAIRRELVLLASSDSSSVHSKCVRWTDSFSAEAAALAECTTVVCRLVWAVGACMM